MLAKSHGEKSKKMRKAKKSPTTKGMPTLTEEYNKADDLVSLVYVDICNGVSRSDVLQKLQLGEYGNKPYKPRQSAYYYNAALDRFAVDTDIEMEKLKEEDEKEKEMRRMKERDLAEYHKLQNEEKKRIVMDEFARMNKDSYLNLKRFENENDDFIKYAEYQIEKYKSQGKNILPLLIELKKYKQKYCIH